MNGERKSAAPRDGQDMKLAHVEFYVEDLDEVVDRLAESYGFTKSPEADVATSADTHRSAVMRGGLITLVVTQALSETHFAHDFVWRHGDGVGNLGIGVADVTAAFEDAVERGAVAVSAPQRNGTDGAITAVIRGFGDVLHTFVEHREKAPAARVPSSAVRRIDHLAVCLEAGELNPTTEYYESALGFSTIFEERIVIGSQAMLSKVVQSPSAEITLTLIEPDTRMDAGQIDEFLKRHNGAGVQHIAFETNDIVRSVSVLSDKGVDFLSTPATYYDALADRLDLATHSVDELRQRNILVDEDHDGQLFQIFARSTHPRNTLFFEVIERLGAKTFGSGNIKALYEAVEAARVHGETST